MRLTLNEVTARLINVNPRPELHGEDKKPAADLKFHTLLPNSELAQFHPMLKAMLYVKDTDQADLVSQNDPEHATALRFPLLCRKALSWESEIVGGKVTIHHGISAKSHLVLDGAIVNEFRLEPLQGGTVGITFRVQIHPDEKTAGKLCMLTGTDMTISVEPPAEEQDALKEAA